VATIGDFLQQTRSFIRDTGLYTTLTAVAPAGSQSIQPMSVSRIKQGQVLSLDTMASGIQEQVTVQSVSGLTVNLASPTLLEHAEGAVVSALAFDDTELTDLVQAAVADYSRWKPYLNEYTLNIQAGVSVYQLPTDWITRDPISWRRATRPLSYPRIDPLGMGDWDGAFVWPTTLSTDQPDGPPVQVVWYDAQQQVTIDPTPTAATTIGPFRYFAMHVVAADSSTIAAQDQGFVCRFAAAQALRALAVDQTKLSKYSVGGSALAVDQSKVPDQLIAQAAAHEAMYDERVRKRAILTDDSDDHMVRPVRVFPVDLPYTGW